MTFLYYMIYVRLYNIKLKFIYNNTYDRPSHIKIRPFHTLNMVLIFFGIKPDLIVIFLTFIIYDFHLNFE